MASANKRSIFIKKAVAAHEYAKAVLVFFVFVVINTFNCSAEISFQLYGYDYFEIIKAKNQYDFDAIPMSMTALFNKRLIEVKGRDWYIENIIKRPRRDNDYSLIVLCFMEHNAILLSHENCDENSRRNTILEVIDHMSELNDTIIIGEYCDSNRYDLGDEEQAKVWVNEFLETQYADFFTHRLQLFGSGITKGVLMSKPQAFGSPLLFVDGVIRSTNYCEMYFDYCKESGVKALTKKRGIGYLNMDGISDNDINIYMDWLEKYWEDILSAPKPMEYTFTIPFTYNSNESYDFITVYKTQDISDILDEWDIFIEKNR